MDKLKPNFTEVCYTRAMDALTKVHHSLEDWDYEPNRGLGIAIDQFVSAPSSLKEQAVDKPGDESVWVFLKPALGQCIERGRFITYHRTTHAVWKDPRIFFWTQALPPNGYPDDTYLVLFQDATIDLSKRIAGVTTLIKREARDYAWNLNTWYRYRVTWYTYVNASLDTILRVIVDIEQAGDWVEKINEDIASPLWLASETKRVGFSFRGSDTSPSWIDDTEVWGPA